MAAGEVLQTTDTARLDWSGPEHWSQTKAACRCCGTPTRSRDGQGRACHQTCAVDELVAERAGQRGRVVVDERAVTSGGFRTPGGGAR